PILKVFIVNASFLIAIYAELERQDLIDKLCELGYELLIPKGVLEELKNGKGFVKIQKDISSGKIKILESILETELNNFSKRYPSLHRGELEVIIQGLKLKDRARCILDDKRARKVSRSLGLRIIGTLGVLKLLKDNGAINQHEFEDILRELKQKGFRLPTKF
ncbi:hypothetical protein DRN86_05310, partial [Candidatus Geothermarchaeota archaeon]